MGSRHKVPAKRTTVVWFGLVEKEKEKEMEQGKGKRQKGKGESTKETITMTTTITTIIQSSDSYFFHQVATPESEP